MVFVGAVAYILLAPKGREDPATLGDTPSSADGGEGTAETEATADAEDTKHPEDTEDGVTDAPEADATDKSVDESADNSGIVEK